MEENFGVIFKKSYDLLLKNIKAFSIVYAIFFVPTTVLVLLGVGSFKLLQTADAGPSGLSVLISAIIFILTILISLFYSIALIKTVHNVAQDQSVNAVEMYKQAKDIFSPFAIVSILVFVKVILWSLLLIVPGIIFSVLYGFSSYSVIIDDKRGNEALAFSKSVIKSNLKEFLLKMFALMGAMILAAILISLVSAFFILIPFIGVAVGTIASEVVKAALGIYALIFSYYLYQDLKNKTVAQI
ncbi:MAG: hypothetical protein PHY73_00110 [Candidatus Omnitrophica bacterium]|nr:hypothetical protein [Candidatus Omnitrophota bacterium]